MAQAILSLAIRAAVSHIAEVLVLTNRNQIHAVLEIEVRPIVHKNGSSIPHRRYNYR